MQEAILNSRRTNINTTNDSVVIVRHIEGIPGGRTLDVTGFDDDQISAGHVIIKDNTSGKYKPLPKNGILPANHDFIGILVSSLDKNNAQAAIMLRGTVNESYCRYPVSVEAKTKLNLIIFIKE